jgi:hypothetical protein
VKQSKKLLIMDLGVSRETHQLISIDLSG